MSAELIARLLDTLDVLEFAARHLHPPEIEALAAALADRDAALRAALRDAKWPQYLPPLQAPTHQPDSSQRARYRSHAAHG